MNTPYPTSMDINSLGSYTAGFRFPEGFMNELLEKFPSWDALRDALDQKDQILLWSYIDLYQKRLGKITPEMILEAEKNGVLQEIVNQAREAIWFKEFIEGLKERYDGEFKEIEKECEEEGRRLDKINQEIREGRRPPNLAT